MYRASNPSNDDWIYYLNRISGEYCPFLKKSSDLDLTYFTTYDISQEENWEEIAFAYSLIHTELLRIKKKSEEGLNKILLCENILFKTRKMDVIQKEMFFQWIHWAMKTLYTKKGILFGKFWPEERKKSKDGKFIPDPPSLFLSIRSTVGPADARFFDVAPKLKDVHKKYHDDGQSIFDGFYSKDLERVNILLKKIDHKITDKNKAISLAKIISGYSALQKIVHEKGFEFI